MLSEGDRHFVADGLGSMLDDWEFEAVGEAALRVTLQDALASLLDSFDAYCLMHQVRYFLFGDSLKGAVCYGDFVPGASSVQIGMVFSEYEKLKHAWFEDGSHGGNSERSWTICFPHVGKSGDVELLPSVRSSRCFLVKHKGKVMFGEDSFPLEIRYPRIELSIFDAVPDEYLTRKSFMRQTRRWSKVIANTVSARAVFTKRGGSPSVSNLAYAVIPLRFSMWRLSRCATRYEGLGAESFACVRGERSKVIHLGCPDSYRRVLFHGVSTWIPGGYTPWNPCLDSVTKERLREVQSVALEVAAEVHRVCAELGIGYFICGGTLLGYVRHGGFIPWDDDIDIGMLRSDYQKFLECASQVMDTQRFFLQTRESDPSIPYLYSKVRMNGTSYPTEYSRFREFHQGIGVDLFPFDDLPDDIAQQRALLSKARVAARRHTSLASHQYPPDFLKWDAAKRSALPGYTLAFVVGRVMACYYNRRSLSVTQSDYEKLVCRERLAADGSPSEYVGCFVPSYTMAKRSDLFPCKEVDFSGVTLLSPANPDAFLRMQYGNYWRVPLPHERTSHGVIEE